VSISQYLLLGSLAQHAAPLTMTEIAKRMNHTTAAATGLVDRLERMDFARREPGEHDRRKVFVQLTDKGSELVARVRQDMAVKLQGLMAILDENEQCMWLRIYGKIYPYCMEQ
jgi:DNA-binding MarR family transcriptional regulator